MEPSKISDQLVSLNFLALNNHDFNFEIYRSVSNAQSAIERGEDNSIRRYKLPQMHEAGNNDQAFSDYLVSINKVNGFDPFMVNSFDNPYLTCFYLYHRLLAQAKTSSHKDTFYEDDSYRHVINFILSKDEYGKECVGLEPYYYGPKKHFGYITGFHYKSDLNVVNRQILIKSLSLSRDGRENKDYYVDHFRKIEEFLSSFRKHLFPMHISDGYSLDVIWPSEGINTIRLNSKSYLFSDGKNSNSQFKGMKDYGPLEQSHGDPLICFFYRQEDKPYAYDLNNALQGKTFATFSGFTNMFRLTITKENIRGIAIDNFDTPQLLSAIEKYKTISKDRLSIPVIIFPWSKLEQSVDGNDIYYRLKHVFLSQKIPTQLVSLQRLKNKESLKWSASNIALAIFGKLGGKPWKVSPRHDKCLIIGIGQSHRRDSSGSISKYFAYSVLSDSSGIYDSIRILSHTEKRKDYLDGLVENIKSVLCEYTDRYERFVVHTPFKLRRDEMNAIFEALNSYKKNEGCNKTLVVLKFNEKSKYFGFALTNNSKVPFESTCLSLGKDGYLVWFEGLQYHNPTLRRRISRPMHIEFTYPTKQSSGTDDGFLADDDKIAYIQDAINLSGANWRGFNAKTLPVSVYYAKLIADYIGNFDRLGLEEIDIQNLPPWFL
ncbi:MAG: Piwi domain protein [bacterium ADurb.Bin236]|nr:MAG: Piwi domain protein [bacterium ADurb.Bin236]